MTEIAAAAWDDADLLEVIATGATRLAVDLDRGQLDLLVAYVRLIERWNATYNLTAIRDVKTMATHHIVDSLSILPALGQARGDQRHFRLLDVGSGAGLPGVVIAVAHSDAVVVCVDSVGKKTSFIAHVAAALGLQNLSSIQTRVEALRSPPSYQVITSRAFASLPDFVSSTRHLLQPGGCWMAMKGKIPWEELTAVRAMTTEFEVCKLDVPAVHADRCVLIGRNLDESKC